MNHIRRIAVLGSFIVLAAGCDRVGKAIGDKVAEKTIEAQTGGQVKMSGSGSGQTVNFKAKDNSGEVSMGEGTKLPDDFPKSIPIYPGATVTLSSRGIENGKTGYVVALSTPDAADKVAAYYKGEMKVAPSAELNMGPSHMLVFGDEKSDQKLVVQLAPQGDKTMIQLSAQVALAK